LFKQASQAFDLSFQLGDAALERLAAGASGLIHAGKIAKSPASSCAPMEFISPHCLTR
jgi:hypothetical protein